MKAALVLLLCGVCAGEESSTAYKKGDDVALVSNKVGPFANPTETYQYYTLPFCRPENMDGEKHGIGEYLAGDRKVKTPYGIKFMGEFGFSATRRCSCARARRARPATHSHARTHANRMLTCLSLSALSLCSNERACACTPRHPQRMLSGKRCAQ